MQGLLPLLDALVLANPSAPTDATGKRKVDGNLAATRLGQSVSARWLNERFRQTMVLLLRFRSEWPDRSLLSHDDVEFLRVALDTALAQASSEGHTGDIYDLNPTTWAIWLVQHAHATRNGAWTAESEASQRALSFEHLYRWLETQHARGEQMNLYDPSTRQLLHRYKLPFKAHMRIPPQQADLFKWRKGAKRLSDWMQRGGLVPIDPAIQNLLPAALVEPPQLQSRREQARNALWSRVAHRARERRLRSVIDGDEDGELTRGVVRSVMHDSRAAGRGMTDAEASEMEEQLERELELEEQPPAAAPPQEGAEEEEPIHVVAERIGPPPDSDSDGQLWHISGLLGEIQGLQGGA